MKACLLCVVSYYPFTLVCYSSLSFLLYISSIESNIMRDGRYQVGSKTRNGGSLLNIIAIFFALVVVVVAVNAAVWGYSHTYLLQECLAEGVSLP